jgi:hypothetical protein
VHHAWVERIISTGRSQAKRGGPTTFAEGWTPRPCPHPHPHPPRPPRPPRPPLPPLSRPHRPSLILMFLSTMPKHPTPPHHLSPPSKEVHHQRPTNTRLPPILASTRTSTWSHVLSPAPRHSIPCISYFSGCAAPGSYSIVVSLLISLLGRPPRQALDLLLIPYSARQLRAYGSYTRTPRPNPPAKTPSPT